MCSGVPSLDTKAIYLPEMTACVWVCMCVCILLYPHSSLEEKKSNSHCKIAETLAAHCSGCNGVAVKHVSYKKKTVTLRDAAVSDLHVVRTVMVDSFTSEDVW